LVSLGDFAHHLRAHVLELSASSISLATVTPSLVRAGRAEALVDDDIAALRGPALRVRRQPAHRRREKLLAGIGAEFYVFSCHVLSLLVKLGNLRAG